MSYVLDATAIRAGMSFAGDDWFTTPSVMEEVKLGKQGRDINMLAGITITVRAPSEDFLKQIIRAAERTGDMAKLSGTDKDILALALELEATLFSNDYAVQNIATILKIPYKTDFNGIREVIHWTYRCRGCGRYFDKGQPDCPVCGSEIRVVKKSQRKRN